MKYSAALPNLLVATPSAVSIYNAVYFSDVYAPLLSSVKTLESLSSWAISVTETDGAYACDKLWARLLVRNAKSRVLDCHFRCRLHGLQLIEALVLSILPGDVCKGVAQP
jgi:hypothetical protein